MLRRPNHFSLLSDQHDPNTPAMCHTLDGRELCATAGCTCGALHIIGPMLVAHNNELAMLLRSGFIIPTGLDTKSDPVAQSKLHRLENIVSHLDADCWTWYTLTTVTRNVIDPDFWHGFPEDLLAQFVNANNEEYRSRELATTNDAKLNAKLFDDFINQRGWWGSVFFPLLTKIFKEVCDVGDESIYDKLAGLIHTNLDGKTLDVFLGKFTEMTLVNWRTYLPERPNPWYLEIEHRWSKPLTRGSFSD